MMGLPFLHHVRGQNLESRSALACHERDEAPMSIASNRRFPNDATADLERNQGN